MQLVTLTNQYGGKIAACPQHIDAKRRFILGNVTETTTDGECDECRQEMRLAALPLRVREALASPLLTHTRYQRGYVYIYHRDDTSPTGVMLASSIGWKEFDAIFAEMKAAGTAPAFASPLSPTERR